LTVFSLVRGCSFDDPSRLASPIAKVRGSEVFGPSVLCDRLRLFLGGGWCDSFLLAAPLPWRDLSAEELRVKNFSGWTGGFSLLLPPPAHAVCSTVYRVFVSASFPLSAPMAWRARMFPPGSPITRSCPSQRLPLPSGFGPAAGSPELCLPP